MDMNDFFHWLAQPYHVPVEISTNGAFLAQLGALILCSTLIGFGIGMMVSKKG